MSDNLGSYLLTTAAKDEWQKTGVKKRAGVLAPLFSVYSRESVGIGDFADLKLLVDWAVRTGNSVIQLLPLNDTGSVFCPYDSLSSFALEPAYICLRLFDSYHKESIRKKIEAIKQIFPVGSGRIDYGIKKAKTDLLWSIFIEEGNCENGEFKKFIDDNNYWLLDFALFKVLKKYLKDRAWYDWQACYKDRDAAE
jgi:4-alpha-glucanotransferase